MRLPRNIATMSDAERAAWSRSLTQEEYERCCDRTFKDVEYSISEIDEHGDIVDNDFFESIAEAMLSWEKIISEWDGGAMILEKRTYKRNVVSTDKEDERDETIRTYGEKTYLAAGGWDRDKS